jgi:outer membrane lipoprotein SlyB
MSQMKLVKQQVLLWALLSTTLFASADIIVLHDGTSYSGHYTPAGNGTLSFTDNQGIHYDLPVGDVQSIVFSNAADHLTLRNGKTYSGQLNGTQMISFEGSGGIDYQFPFRDVSSLVITGSPAPSAPHRIPTVVIPEGTDIVVLTSDAIKSGQDSSGQLYPATIQQDVYGSAGSIAIPAGTRAQLVVSNVRSGGAVHSPELVLDLYSIDVHGEQYRVDTSSVTESNRSGLGANRRTAEYTGGGAGIGALMGAVFGGGKGAGIGALAGAGGGALTQLFTRGKEISVPAETALTFRLDKTLVMHP